MKKLSALLLSLLLLLTACGTPATPGDAATLPTPNDEILVEEGLRAEDLPEVCRLWFDLAETSGAADKNSKLPLASRADEGACNYLAVRLPDGTYTDLIQEGKLADEGVTLADFSGGRAKQEGSYGQLAWNGELYHAFTVSAADCTLPNLTAPDGGILRLNISGDCTVDGSKLKISSTGTYTMSTSGITMLKNNSHRAATGISIPAGAEMTITAKVNDTVALTKTFNSDDVIDGHFYLNDVLTSAGESAVVAGSTNTLSFTFEVTALSGDAYIEYGSLFQTAASVMGFKDLTSAPVISSTTSIATPTYSVNLNDGGQLNTPITTDGTYLYFGTWQGNKSYYQWNPTTNELNSVSGSGFYWAGAAVIGDQVFFGGDSGKLYYTSTDNFELGVEEISLDSDAGNIRSSIMVDGDYFYFTSQGKYLWCFKANADGAPTLQWRTLLNAVSTSTPTKVGNKIYVGYYNGFNKGGVTEVTESRTASASSYVSKCDLIDGTGSTANNMPVQSSLVVLPNADSSAAAYVYFSSNSNVGAGYCYAVNGTTATKVWDTSAAGGGTYALGGMASDGGYMVFGNDYNNLYIVK